jgi:hypothetical protein
MASGTPAGGRNGPAGAGEGDGMEMADGNSELADQKNPSFGLERERVMFHNSPLIPGVAVCARRPARQTVVHP